MGFKSQIVASYLLIIIHVSFAVDKWSRQLEPTGPGSETYDWIPVAQPVDTKDRTGRVITYQQNFPPNGPFGELQKNNHVPPPQQVQPFGFPFHFQRFQQPQAQVINTQSLNSQPQLHQQQNTQQHKLHLQPQQPTSQSFFKFEMPFNRDGNRNQDNSQGVQTGYQIQHSSFGAQQPLFQTPLLTQKQFFPPEFHPLQRPQQLQQQLQQPKPVQQNFIEEPVKTFRDPSPVPSVISSTVPPAPTFPIQQGFDLQKPASFQSQLPFQASAVAAPVPSANTQQDKEVQLLYVPYDTLYNQQRNENPAFENSQYNIGSHQQVNPYQINNFYMPENIQTHVANKFTTSTTTRPTASTFKPTPYQSFLSPHAAYTTSKPKPKAHQPPLAMFLFKSSNYPSQIDVVNELKDAKTIAVLDAPTQQAPSVFVGPAGMQTPNGYVKFDLPYLSQLAQNSNIADVHFFVAPLSYRTPTGFNKILLPEPHVGSIVVNKQKYAYNNLKSTHKPLLVTIPPVDSYNEHKYGNHISSTSQKESYNVFRDKNPTSTVSPHRNTNNGIKEFNQQSPSQHIFITPNQNEVQEIPSTTPATRQETTQRVKSTSPREYYPEIVRDLPKLNRNRFPYEITTQKQNISPYRGNKYSEISANKDIQSEQIQEVTSPKIFKPERVKPTYQVKRPESQYAQFRPIPNNIPAEDFYKVQPIRTNPTPTSTSSTTTTTTTTTSTTAPRPHFTQSYPTSPQISFQSTRGQVYHSNDETTKSPISNSGVGDRFPTHPLIQQQSQSQPSDEEYRMKQYYRQQDAFRNRPLLQTTTSRPAVENIPYTPVSVDYDREVRIPSSTPTYTTTTSPRPTTLRQRVTYYHPTPTTAIYEENSNTVTAKTNVFEFSRDTDAQTTNSPAQEVVIAQSEKTKMSLYSNPINSKLKNNHNDVATTETSDVEYEPNPYQLPSELPPLTPNLPGLVNGLVEQNKLIGETETTIQMDLTTTPTPDTRPTRRLINRVKKPIVSKVSQSVSYSSSDYSTRRPINRTRRPYTGRNYTTTSTSTTIRPSSSRVPIIRNPNRIRYHPTPEERQTLRIKSKKHGSNGKKSDNSDDLEYQRDVLKQNYPVFKPSTKTTTTALPNVHSTEKSTYEQQQIYTVTPTSEQTFDGLIEPMQIAQQYQEYPQNNYGPGYFPNEEEVIPTEAAQRNEISPVYATSSTTEEPQATTRRSPFIRRGPRIKTTTESPSTSTTSTTDTNEDQFTTRTRVPPRRVVKVRARTRRPHPASSTPNPSEDIVEPEKNNYNKLSRFNQELYQDEITQRRQRIKSQFHLEPQESQWSPSLSGKSINSFQPLKANDFQTVTKTYDNEPEIVTAKDDLEQTDSYVFNVSARFGPTTHLTSTKANDTFSPMKKSEKSFADLLEEVMSDIGKESDTKSSESVYFDSQKMDSYPNRQGKWKNSNTGETFETAESQNIGAQFFNSLYTGTIEKSTESMLKFEEMYATTPSPGEIDAAPATFSPEIATESNALKNQDISTPSEFTPTSSVTSEDSTTNLPDVNQQESITHRIDDLWNVEDLDSQPSMFSEVRKQLNELFKETENDSDNDQDTVEFVQPHKHEYKNIQRVRTTAESTESTDESAENEKEIPNAFHKNLMESVVYATSTSSKDDASETEICYRGHCIRSEDLPPNHKLH